MSSSQKSALSFYQSKGEVPFNWVCPHCSMSQTVVSSRYSRIGRDLGAHITVPQYFSNLLLEHETITCSNPECGKITVSVAIGTENWSNLNKLGDSQYQFTDEANLIYFETLIPTSYSKIVPEYVPKAIRDDYYEACLIRTKSPKAAATLIRRCLQGMIRDFCKISKNTLAKEIEELGRQIEVNECSKEISIESVEAIDAVRSIGNIGAHMEHNVNLIIDIDDDEVSALIQLTETLIDDWYVEREKRKQRFSKVKEIAIAKKNLKNQTHNDK